MGSSRRFSEDNWPQEGSVAQGPGIVRPIDWWLTGRREKNRYCRAVKCTACQRAVADGTSICPHCDAILDFSFLGDLPTDAGEDTPVPKPVRPAPGTGTRSPPPKVRRAPVDDLPPRPVPQQAVPPPAPERETFAHGAAALPAAGLDLDASPEDETQPAGDLEDHVHPELARGWAAFRSLSFEDKLTAGSASALALMSAMPWRSSLADGDELGILGWGVLTLALAAAAGASLWARRAGKQRPLSGAQWPLLAIACGGAAVAVSAVAIVTSYERTIQFGAKMTTAWPAFGAYGAVLCAGGVLLGGLLTLMQVRRG